MTDEITQAAEATTEAITQIAEETIQDANSLTDAIGASIPMFLISFVVIGGLIALMVFIFVRDKKKRILARKREIQFYKDNMFKWVSEPRHSSGNVSYDGTYLYYSRGARQIKIDVDIDRVTRLPFSAIDPWFEGRNYNEKEAENILEDIQEYLVANRICRKVYITDEDEDLLYDYDEDDDDDEIY